jgi:hypothetical protein
MIEELTKEGHPGVERSRNAFVGRHIGDDQATLFVEDAHLVGHGEESRLRIGRSCLGFLQGLFGRGQDFGGALYGIPGRRVSRIVAGHSDLEGQRSSSHSILQLG